MKNKIRRLRTSYGNLKIKYKLFLLVSWIMIISFLITFIGLRYAFQIYDEQLYSKSSQVLSTTSNSIEMELKNMEDVTYKILTDPQIQQYLSKVNLQVSEYDKFILRNQINDKILSYVNKEPYILSANLIDTNGEEYVAGPRAIKLTKSQKDEFEKSAKQADGSNVWVNPNENKFTIITAREVKDFNTLHFDTLGTLVIFVNMEKLVGNTLAGSQKMDGNFLIADDKGIIFPTEPPLHVKDTVLDMHYGYQFKKINGKNYFFVYKKSDYFDWGYVNAIPFNQIFKNINLIKSLLIFSFIVMFIIVTISGMRFARNITMPLENLVSGIQQISAGDFKEARKEVLKSSIQEDEVGKLQQNFHTMVQQIDELINENYSKQLTIKETEFKALQAQINPHFLYNTLESINWLAKANGQTQISNMVESLGYLLRNSISLKEPLIPIEEELATVKNYIIIQKYRFEERLDFQMDVDQELLRYTIPKLTLQPLVENAIHYALEPMIETCKIRIYSTTQEDSFKLIVEDNGPGMDPQILEKMKKGEIKTRGQGVGLTNIHDRINLSYGEKYGVEIESAPNQGTRVIIVLPLDKGEKHV